MLEITAPQLFNIFMCPQNSASHSKVESQINRRVNSSATRCNARPNKNNQCCRRNCRPGTTKKLKSAFMTMRLNWKHLPKLSHLYFISTIIFWWIWHRHRILRKIILLYPFCKLKKCTYCIKNWWKKRWGKFTQIWWSLCDLGQSL